MRRMLLQILTFNSVSGEGSKENEKTITGNWWKDDSYYIAENLAELCFIVV